MKKLLASILMTSISVFASSAYAADPASCSKVRISDLGWTDIALTNTTAETILKALGYQPEQSLLALNITYEMLKTGKIDVFLGNWRPIQDEQFKSYYDEGSVVPLATNLEGAKYTLAVPKYVSDAGVHSFADLAKHREKFEGKIYTIEPGSSLPLFEMVEANRHGLGDWEIVETSEAAMLSQVNRSLPREAWIAFMGWEPHPMNMNIEMSYLSGGDIEFGPNFGGATVRTIARKGLKSECPNLAQFFTNLIFDLNYENIGMDMIMNQNKSPTEAALAMMSNHPEKLEQWLKGVTTIDGQPGLAAVTTALEK